MFADQKMKQKKKRIYLAKQIRQTYQLAFIESLQLAREVLRGNLYEAARKLGYTMKPKKPCRCGYCIGIDGVVYETNDKNGNRVVLDPEDIENLLKS